MAITTYKQALVQALKGPYLARTPIDILKLDVFVTFTITLVQTHNFLLKL